MIFTYEFLLTRYFENVIKDKTMKQNSDIILRVILQKNEIYLFETDGIYLILLYKTNRLLNQDLKNNKTKWLDICYRFNSVLVNM